MPARTLTAASLIALLALSGCLERKETIRVAQNGGVELRVELYGDPGDFEGGDALPSQETGWKTEDTFVTEKAQSAPADDDADQAPADENTGERKQRRIAERRFGPDEPLPDSYAGDDAALAEVALRFPTTVETERTPDGQYTTFKRVYSAREFNRFNAFNEAVKKQLDTSDLGVDPAQMSPEQLRSVVEGLRKLEGLTRGEYALLAAESLGERWPARYGVMLRKTVIDCMADVDVMPMVELLAQPASADRDARLNELALTYVDAVHEELEAKLREWRVPRREADEFFTAFEQEERRWKITQDINDEKWEVRVELPGEIIAHNGEKAGEHAVIWKFEGKAVNDCDHVIFAVSRLERPEP